HSLKILCFLWLTKHTVDSAQLSAPEVVTGTYNGSVTISCQYSLQFKEYTKYWCKGQVYELCTIIVKTPKVRQNDRSSIVDDKEAGVFTVTMTLLQKTDEDMYWCVIARHGRNIFSPQTLSWADRQPITPTDNLESPINLSMFLDCVGGSRRTRREPTLHGENMQTPCRRIPVPPPERESATVVTNCATLQPQCLLSLEILINNILQLCYNKTKCEILKMGIFPPRPEKDAPNQQKLSIT
uniref:Immunoglobulin V-set domain-containing protein n=1 Tax=Stegastes partitus TaxID=144197 RepID=A0A3B5B9Z1_9TELE